MRILEAIGVLVVQRRIVRVRTASGFIVVRNGSNLYAFRELPRLPPVKLPETTRRFSKVHRTDCNHKTQDQSERPPPFWQREGALRGSELVKFGAGNDHWRSRARASLANSGVKGSDEGWLRIQSDMNWHPNRWARCFSKITERASEPVQPQ